MQTTNHQNFKTDKARAGQPGRLLSALHDQRREQRSARAAKRGAAARASR